MGDTGFITAQVRNIIKLSCVYTLGLEYQLKWHFKQDKYIMASFIISWLM